MDDDVAEAGKPLESLDDLGRELAQRAQGADRIRVGLEAQSSVSAQITREVDDGLTDQLQRMEDVVAEREVAAQLRGSGDPRPQLAQVDQMPPQLSQPFDERAHR